MRGLGWNAFAVATLRKVAVYALRILPYLCPMKVEIWSDIMCPFCYIGKRKFEAALAQFANRDEIELSWRSYQLDPTLVSMPGTNAIQYLADRKGQSLAWSQQAHAHVTQAAAAVGLDYRFDKAVVANSMDAHRLIHLAKAHGLDDVAEERIFKAYFTEGLDIADLETLVQLGVEIGLGASAVREMLQSQALTQAVRDDCALAAELGTSGVPFFVLDRKYGVTGAQEPATFLQALEKAHAAWKASMPTRVDVMAEGAACGPDGDCN
jgi:predicted DsbA family dithiol-disulfide isomerase